MFRYLRAHASLIEVTVSHVEQVRITSNHYKPNRQEGVEVQDIRLVQISPIPMQVGAL